jgi:Protein of unknown function DUF262
MRNNYIEILNSIVEIPIIQRDYAQGRTDNKTNKIRKDFLTVLFGFIEAKHLQSPEKQLELDFIYGFNNSEENGVKVSFVPIDGQQRLTTLWLLYWLVSAKEKIPAPGQLFLSNFLYETRHSTSEFCKNLIAFKPEFKSENIVKEIKNQSWYFETWDYDPSVQAMLVVLKDIEERYCELQIPSVWELIAGISCPFYFYKLDMDKVGLTDDLYIKMNSRGKALTEFEYFKAGFSEILVNAELKERFENSIDQHWIEAVWDIVLSSVQLEEDDDIALKVDDCFLNLFNFITSVIAFQKDIQSEEGIRYKDTEVSGDLLKVIYSDIENQNILFETLDAICKQQVDNKDFWEGTFYFDKNDFDVIKTRLYFQHGEANLLERCLFYFGENSGFSLQEQVLLHACFTQLKTNSENFENKIRVIRNLVVNSDNELRESALGRSFLQAEGFMLNGDMDVFNNFKTSQIEEEKRKKEFLTAMPDAESQWKKLEDSDIFRASISLFPLDEQFAKRSEKFLELFDEDDIINDFNTKSNLLLTFGDYSQDDGGLTNMMSANKAIARSFLTSPGFNKDQFYTRTQKVIVNCLDYFIESPAITISQKINESLSNYSHNSKDWAYYFMKYPSFRCECTRGYYYWEDNYPRWKMRVKQFNGYNWDPFLYELKKSSSYKNLSLDNYEAKLLLIVNRKKVAISSLASGKGFLFENAMSAGVENTLLEELIAERIINKSHILAVKQDEEGHDLEDRIKKLSKAIEKILNK